jgi:hypothetical protein
VSAVRRTLDGKTAMVREACAAAQLMDGHQFPNSKTHVLHAAGPSQIRARHRVVQTCGEIPLDRMSVPFLEHTALDPEFCCGGIKQALTTATYSDHPIELHMFAETNTATEQECSIRGKHRWSSEHVDRMRRCIPKVRVV